MSISGAEFDVAIMGGGLAGLTLATQLKRAMPDMTVMVAERAAHPPPDAAFKVGESTVEGAGHYLRNVLGLRHYLETEQLIKPGLRFYFTDGDNRDITTRLEVGEALEPVTYQSYQLDRGRFEAKLAQYAQEHGVTFLDECTVQDVQIGAPHHAVTVTDDTREWTVRPRWVVDASGRRGTLKRQLGLERDVAHQSINAVWFRLEGKVDIGTWDTDERWQRRVEQFDYRWRSTNHLMGAGYWVWLIPLGPEFTSIGIVADERQHALSGFNTFDKAVEWLRVHEPQCHEAVRARREHKCDFRVMRKLAFGCSQMYSADRWCLAGNAGVFHDPFYSPGSDVIAINNTYITSLISKDLQGTDITSTADRYNQAFLRDFVDPLFDLYTNKYPLMANGQVFTAKIAWDYAWYWAVACPMFFQAKLTDDAFAASVQEQVVRANALGKALQAMFVQWHDLDGGSGSAGHYVDLGEIAALTRLHDDLGAGYTDDVLRANFTRNITLLEDLAKELFWRAVRALPEPPERQEINPYVIGLDPRRWQEDGLFVGAPEALRDDDLKKDLSPLWFEPRYV